MKAGKNISITIRTEKEEDFPQVDEVLRQAFAGEEEVVLVDKLRKNGNYISLVAFVDQKIVGHIFFSPAPIKSSKGVEDALALAPVAILPSYQNQGIGTILIEKGLNESRKQGHQIVTVLGHPEYYPRFGFVMASSKGIEAPFSWSDEAFMILILQEGALNGVKGVVSYPPEFGGF
ncbi:MAG: hypothetical protein BME94_04490 [Methanobacteriales archaeon Met13]